MTGCQGEMVEEEFMIYIEDENGNVIVDQMMTSLENGFIDLWLPRNQSYVVKVEHDGRVAEAEITTYKDDATCITTMQLS